MTLGLIDGGKSAGKQRFRWQLKSPNGRIVGASCEGFSSRRKCMYNFRLVRFSAFSIREK